MARTRLAAAESTQERILRVALVTFAEKGFDGAATREIASRAGVNLGLLQYHFGSKVNLWKAAVDRAFAALTQALAGFDDDNAVDGSESVRTLLRAYVRFAAANPEFVLMMNDEGKRSGPRMRWLVDRHVRPVYERVTQMVSRAQAQGGLPPAVPTFHYFYMLLGATGMLFHQAPECRRLAGIDPFDPAVIEAHADAVANLFVASWQTAATRAKPRRVVRTVAK